MKLSAGERIKIIRDLTGYTREQFAEQINVELLRMRNIEQGKVRVAEMEFAGVGILLPEMVAWLVYEGDIVLDDLKNSESPLSRLIAARIDAGHVPEEIKDKLK